MLRIQSATDKQGAASGEYHAPVLSQMHATRQENNHASTVHVHGCR